MELRLLHLSDIHFQNLGQKDYLDNNSDLRNELEFDLEKIVSEIGSINAVLISGDIAYSAKEEEYLKATDWLETICKICGCLEENVLPVCGNHDVNRDAIGAMLCATHEKFKELRNRIEIDKELHKYLMQDEDFSILLSPLKNYYSFAQKYNAIPAQNSLFWEKDFHINDIKLRVKGLNSAIISNGNDDEHSSKLILGGHQTTLKREKGVIYLTLCHHPPQWLYDGNDVEKDLNARAKIQLFGHKHDFNVIKINETLRLSSGAVHPERNENSWEPRYNIIGLSIVKEHEDKYLKVKIWERIWDKTDKIFKAKYSDSGRKFRNFDLLLNEDEKQSLHNGKKSMVKRNKVKNNENIELINLTEPNPKRKLAYLFFDLPYPTRIEIASELKLIEDSDENLNSIQRSQIYFKKAIEQKLLYQLWEEVAKLNTDIRKNTNPFKKII